MKKFLFILASAAYLAAGCQDEVNPADLSNETNFLAIVEGLGEDSKTSIDADFNLEWSEGDQLAIFQACQIADKYQIKDTERGEFEIVEDNSEINGNFNAGFEIATNIALYPYMDNLLCQRTEANGETSYNIKGIELPVTQDYVTDSFGEGTLLMAAITENLKNHTLKFKNILGAMRLQLLGTEVVTSITVEGKNYEKLSGKADVTVYTNGDTPSISMSAEANTSVTLNCGTGVQLSPDTPTAFFVTLPPVVFENGFKVTVHTANNEEKTLEATTSNSIIRSSILILSPITLDGEVVNTPESDFSKMVHWAYEESDEIIANPERGLYRHYDFTSSNSSSLSANTLISDRISNGITLCYTGHYLTEFINSDISQKFLNLVKTNMEALRAGGAKCLLRFAYTTDASDANKNNWDASPAWVARHIEQLKPIIQEYSDVILCWQAGFVGVWGEWYYTTHFNKGADTPEEFKVRKDVIDAMLDALPAERMVALRTPMYKKMMYTGDYTNTLTLEEAYKDTPKARLCSFNDCFRSSSNDVGTFEGEDAENYWKTESKYLLMGGETCGSEIDQYCQCNVSIKAMEDYHWTYLNQGHSTVITNFWKNEGCYDEVKRRLGYRLSLADVYHSPTATAGKNFRVAIKIVNTGFAAPMNPRNVELVLVDKNQNKTVYKLDNIDPRYWFAGGEYTINEVIKLPADAAGDYSIYLNLPDPKPSLYNTPSFSIRLANDNVWDEATGYNKLFDFTVGSTIVVEPEPEPTPGEGGTSASGENIRFGTTFNPGW